MAARREVRREGKEGNRWVNVRPSSEELAAWFKANVKIDELLDAEDYVGGLTLIPNNEPSKEVTGWDAGNSPEISKVWDLVFTPYIRIETRVKYFNDLMAAHDDRVGIVEPRPTPEQDPHLPLGFFSRSVATGGDHPGTVRMICCSMKATIYKAGTVKWERRVVDKRTGAEEWVRTGEALVDAAPATKVVPLLYNGGGADVNAVMKAETGAVGRALGMAGILVIPGTGLATAEDMQELAASGIGDGVAGSVLADEPELPPEGGGTQAPADADERLRDEVKAAMERMNPTMLAQFKGWAADRGFARLSEVTSPALRGIARKAEKMAATSLGEESPDGSSPDPQPE